MSWRDPRHDTSRLSFARSSASPGATLPKFPLGRGKVDAVLLVAVLLDLASHVVKQVFRSLTSEPLADAAVRVPHGTRHAHVYGWRVIGHAPSFRVTTRIVCRISLVWPHSSKILCGHKVLFSLEAQRAATVRHGSDGPRDHTVNGGRNDH